MRKSSTRKSSSGRKDMQHQRRTSIPEDGKIRLLVKENPKRATAAKRFSLYKNGMLVSVYEKKVGRVQALADLRWDKKHRFIKITT